MLLLSLLAHSEVTAQSPAPPQDAAAPGSGYSPPFQVDTRPPSPAPADLRLPEEKRPDRVVSHTPLFAWTFVPAGLGDAQTAYRCRVETLSGETLWEEEKTLFQASSCRYGGSPVLLVDGESYRVRVWVWNLADRASPAAATTFRMNRPPPVPAEPTPAAGSTVRLHRSSTSASWTLPADPEGDTLAVAIYGDLGAVVPATERPASSLTAGTLEGLDASGPYVWRVVVSDGYEGAAGPIWSFTSDRKGAVAKAFSDPFQVDTRPAPQAPQDLALSGEIRIDRVVSHTPVFTWSFVGVNAEDVQTAYQCQVFASDTISGAPIWDSEKVTSVKAIATYSAKAPALQDGQTYTARARVWSRLDKDGSWGSLIFRMNTAPPPPTNPRPVPADTIETDERDLLVHWDLPADADGDSLSVRLLGDFDLPTPASQHAITDTTSGILSGLSSDGVYSWRVLVSDGHEGVEGPVWSFALRGVAPVASIDDIRVGEESMDPRTRVAFALLGRDAISFSGSGAVRGNPAKTIRSHRWTVRNVETSGASEEPLRSISAFEIDASELGDGTFHVYYHLTDSEGNESAPDSATVIVRKDVGLAIIIAGGGYLGENTDYFYGYTSRFTNSIYNLLWKQRRYSREAITYLNPIPKWGEDDDNRPINVTDTDVGPERFRQAIEDARERNVRDAIPLLIFLAGHGGEGVFYINDDDRLAADELKGWLDRLNDTKVSQRALAGPEEIFPGEVVLVVDFCYSRTFLEGVSGPGRVVIGSSSTEVASVTKSGISFGSFFFDGAAKGKDALSSFDDARERVIKLFGQHPYIDTDGDGVPIYDESGTRNPGADGDERIAREIYIGGEFATGSRLRPEIYAIELQGTPAGSYSVTALADSGLAITCVAVPASFDPRASDFTELGIFHLQGAAHAAAGDTLRYTAVWPPPGAGKYHLIVQGVDNLGNLAAHHAVPVTVEGEGGAGDFDGDGRVAFDDFVLFASHFGSRAGAANWDPVYDLDRDEEVGFTDFVEFARAFGQKPALAKPGTHRTE